MAERICTIPGCDRQMVYTTRGLCKRCYRRAITPPALIRPTLPDVKRFEKRIVEGDNGCWIWTGQANRPEGGYGNLWITGRRRVYAHRWSYEYHRAPIPEGLDIDHLCRVTLCVNPWHLEPVTPQENLRRQAAAVTHCKRGHEFTEENTYRPGGAQNRRDCRTCKRAATKRWKKKQPPVRSAFCKNGHPLAGDNLIEKSGVRVCRACRSLAAQAANAKRWAS